MTPFSTSSTLKVTPEANLDFHLLGCNQAVEGHLPHFQIFLQDTARFFNYANDRYQHYAGADSSVRGGSLAELDRELDRAARIEVSEELGHSRESVSTYYLRR